MKHISINSIVYLDGVILVRSSPIVFITLRPSTHNPTDMPAPPYRRIQIGTGAFCAALPVVAVIHSATSGPIALLEGQKSNIRHGNIRASWLTWHYHLKKI